VNGWTSEGVRGAADTAATVAEAGHGPVADASAPAEAICGRPFRVLAVVPLYYPSSAIWARWSDWAAGVDRLLLFDNTPDAREPAAWCPAPSGNVTYVAAGGNRGVAAAFNAAARMAARGDFTHILTLDQDSVPPPDLAITLFHSLPSAEWLRTGLVGPQHAREDIRLVERASATPVERLMSSGCLVNLDAWRAVGGYNEQFFMDHVDSDFCLRLRRAGYRIVCCHQVVMPHRLGASRVHVLLGRRFLVNHHPPARRYTMARNTVGLCSLYGRNFPGLRRRQTRELAGLAIKILLFERRKGAQLIAILRGLWDGFRGRQSLERVHAGSPHADP
jgi:rhamnosyltransferase